MPRVRLGPKFLELGQRLESADAKQVLKDFLFWLANTSTDVHYTKSAILDELLRLAAKSERR